MKYFWLFINLIIQIVDFFYLFGDCTKSPFWGYTICEKCKRPHKLGFAGVCDKCFKSMKIDDKVDQTKTHYEKYFGNSNIIGEEFANEVIRRSGKEGEDYVRRKEYEKKQYIRQKKLDRICKN